MRCIRDLHATHRMPPIACHPLHATPSACHPLYAHRLDKLDIVPRETVQKFLDEFDKIDADGSGLLDSKDLVRLGFG